MLHKNLALSSSPRHHHQDGSALSASTLWGARALEIIDALGIALSGLCLIHCALTPLILGLLPSLGAPAMESQIRLILLSVGLFGVLSGAAIHRNTAALAPLCGALFAFYLVENTKPAASGELLLTWVGSGLLMLAHYKNRDSCGKHCHGSAFRSLLVRTENLPIILAVWFHLGLVGLGVRLASAETHSASPAALAIYDSIELEVSVVNPEVVELPSPGAIEPTFNSISEPQAQSTAPSASTGDKTATTETTGEAPSETAAPVDFSQVLVSGSNHFAVKQGGGSSGSGVAGASSDRSKLVNSTGSQAGSSKPSVRVGPKAPAMSAQLAQWLPHQAKVAGQSGTAVVGFTVESTGTLSGFVIQNESDSSLGFGSACIDALRHSQWIAAIDSADHSVAVQASYTCRFTVN